MQNVAIIVEPEPPRPGLLGLYQGRPLANRSVFESFAMPDKITIYQGPHERMARTQAELEQIVADTLWHEIAHHFGMDEPRVADLLKMTKLHTLFETFSDESQALGSFEENQTATSA